ERGSQRPHRVVGPGATILERCVQQRELRFEGTDTDAQHEATPADDIEGAVPLRDLERMVIAEDEHVGRETNRLGARGDETERRQRIPIPTTARLGHVDRDRDVFAAREMVISEAFGFECDVDDVGERARLLPTRVRAREKGQHRRDDAELQGYRYFLVMIARSAMMFFCTSVAPAPIDVYRWKL
ncbi:MAG: hypothetical protein QOF28_435, partial [Actinomycetota bacterium]|nr:hypothetical protein [Actinomycetota bacterium]